MTSVNISDVAGKLVLPREAEPVVIFAAEDVAMIHFGVRAMNALGVADKISPSFEAFVG